MLAKLLILVSMAVPLAAQTVSDQAAEHANAARLAESHNDFPTAVREYKVLARLMPHSAEVQSNLAVALYFDNDMADAAAASERAIALNPNLFAPHLFGGLAWYRLSNPDRAVEELGKAVRINSSDVLAHLWLGYAYVEQLRYEDAVKEFQAVCRLDPKNVDAWYGLGQSYLQLGKDATARLIAFASDGGRVWQLAGEQYQLQGDKHRALEDYMEAIKRRPDILELKGKITELGGTPPELQQTTHGDSAREDRLYAIANETEKESHAAFDRVMQIDPNSYRAHQIMADVFLARQELDKATQEYQAVLKAKPDLPGIHEELGKVLEESGKLEEALKEYEAEIQLEPCSASAHMHAGQVLLTMGKDDEAEKMLTSALAMDRPPIDVYRLIGKLDLNRKNYQEAVSNLTRYVAVRKDDSTAYYLLSRAYRELGDKEKMNSALAMFRKTSSDVKARNSAQAQLEPTANKGPDSEGTMDSQSATHE